MAEDDLRSRLYVPGLGKLDLCAALSRRALHDDVPKMRLGRVPSRVEPMGQQPEQERADLRNALSDIDRRNPQSLREAREQVALLWDLLQDDWCSRGEALWIVSDKNGTPQTPARVSSDLPDHASKGDVWRQSPSGESHVFDGDKWRVWGPQSRHLDGWQRRRLATAMGFAAVSHLRCARAWLRVLELGICVFRDDLRSVVDHRCVPDFDSAHHWLVHRLRQQNFREIVTDDEAQQLNRLSRLAEQEAVRLIERHRKRQSTLDATNAQSTQEVAAPRTKRRTKTAREIVLLVLDRNPMSTWQEVADKTRPVGHEAKYETVRRVGAKLVGDKLAETIGKLHRTTAAGSALARELTAPKDSLCASQAQTSHTPATLQAQTRSARLPTA